MLKVLILNAKEKIMVAALRQLPLCQFVGLEDLVGVSLLAKVIAKLCYLSLMLRVLKAPLALKMPRCAGTLPLQFSARLFK